MKIEMILCEITPITYGNQLYVIEWDNDNPNVEVIFCLRMQRIKLSKAEVMMLSEQFAQVASRM
jgi:hypothetical protein